jgi:acetyltransferase-like isoleucine patch superfamily enzyme
VSPSSAEHEVREREGRDASRFVQLCVRSVVTHTQTNSTVASFYANYNLILLDCSKVTIGKRVLFGRKFHLAFFSLLFPPADPKADLIFSLRYSTLLVLQLTSRSFLILPPPPRIPTHTPYLFLPHSIYAAGHGTSVVERLTMDERAGEVEIGDDTWVGGSVSIQAGVKIGQGEIRVDVFPSSCHPPSPLRSPTDTFLPGTRQAAPSAPVPSSPRVSRTGASAFSSPRPSPRRVSPLTFSLVRLRRSVILGNPARLVKVVPESERGPGWDESRKMDL